jgi:hypothetical protein
MPQPRKYASRAIRQAAYRQRTRQSQDNLLTQRGLPKGPAISSMPGTARWAAAIKQSESLVAMVIEEMQDYHDDRSEIWQESTQAETFLERIEALQELNNQFSAIGE